MPELVLASASPRRVKLFQEILEDIPFTTEKSGFDESQVRTKKFSAHVLLKAEGKAKAVSSLHPGAIVLGADTIVVFQSRILGKPKDEEEAKKTLLSLTGKKHTVYTAYSLVSDGKVLKEHVSRAELYLDKMSREEIDEYVETGSPLDKAGSYGIQDKDFIHAKLLSGEEETVIGLPCAPLVRDLQAIGVL